MKPPMAKNKDLRNFAVLPIEACRDHRLHGTAAFSVLALICTYCDYLGVTWVSQGRIAKELGVSRPAVARQIKKLRDYGYIVNARPINKWQKSRSMRVVFKNAPKDIDEAKANLTAAQQINVEEGRRQAGLQFKQEHDAIHKKPVDNFQNGGNTVPPPVTSEVTHPVTPLGYTNTPYNDKGISINSDLARQFCVMFLRSAESFGTPRVLNDRDIDVMETWIRNGLTQEQWAKILQDHWQYCRDKHRDYARGIGYFANPVERVTSGKPRSRNQNANSILKSVVRSTRG